MINRIGLDVNSWYTFNPISAFRKIKNMML